MSDPEIRDLQVATARAYAIAERLAFELDATVQDLMQHVHTRPRRTKADTSTSPDSPEAGE